MFVFRSCLVVGSKVVALTNPFRYIKQNELGKASHLGITMIYYEEEASNLDP